MAEVLATVQDDHAILSELGTIFMTRDFTSSFARVAGKLEGERFLMKWRTEIKAERRAGHFRR